MRAPRRGRRIWIARKEGGPPSLLELHVKALQSCKERLWGSSGGAATSPWPTLDGKTGAVSYSCILYPIGIRWACKLLDDSSWDLIFPQYTYVMSHRETCMQSFQGKRWLNRAWKHPLLLPSPREASTLVQDPIQGHMLQWRDCDLSLPLSAFASFSLLRPPRH